MLARRHDARLGAFARGYPDLHRRLRRPVEWQLIPEWVLFVLQAYEAVRPPDEEVRTARRALKQLWGYAE